MRDVQIYLTNVRSEIPKDAEWDKFPLTLPFVKNLDLRITTPVTFLVGENGSGKSTLLEALVDIAGLPVRGGGKGELADHGGEIHEVALEETQHYQITKGILESPERYWRHLRG